MIEITIALMLASVSCFAIFLIQAFLEDRELQRMKEELEEFEEEIWMRSK